MVEELFSWCRLQPHADMNTFCEGQQQGSSKTQARRPPPILQTFSAEGLKVPSAFFCMQAAGLESPAAYSLCPVPQMQPTGTPKSSKLVSLAYFLTEPKRVALFHAIVDHEALANLADPELRHACSIKSPT